MERNPELLLGDVLIRPPPPKPTVMTLALVAEATCGGGGGDDGVAGLCYPVALHLGAVQDQLPLPPPRAA